MASDDGLMSYFAKIGLDVSEFLGGINKADTSILQFYRDVSVSMAATMFVFDKVMQYGQQFVNLANQAAEFVSTIDKLSVTTGMTTEELQRFDNVARYADGDLGSLAMSINRMQMVLSDTGAAGEDARKYLDAMGVSYRNTDGSLKSSAELFPAIIEGIKGLGSSADRVTVANAIFGKSYQSLAGYIDMGSAAMKEHYDEVTPLTETQIQSLRDYEDATKDLAASQDELAKNAGAKLAPSMSEFSQVLDGLAQNDAVIGFFEWLNGALTLVARGFHLMAREAEFVVILATKGVDAANKHDAETEKWVSQKIRDDAMKAAGYKTDGNGNVVAEAEKAATGKIPAANNTAEENRLKALKSATDDLTQAKDDLFDAEKKLQDLNRDYERELSVADIRDVSSIRSRMIRHQWDLSDNQSSIAAAQVKVAAATSAVSGANGDKKYGDVVVNLGDRELARVVGVAIAEGNRSNGIGAYH